MPQIHILNRSYSYTSNFMNYSNLALMTLISIIIVGIIAIPFGNPKFLDRAIVLELCYASLSFLVWKGYTKPLYACILIAMAVIVGNSIAVPHVHLMTTFEKPLNAVVLLVGGYILQGMLIYFSLKIILNKHPIRLSQGFTL
jgi:hypothetical protein